MTRLPSDGSTVYARLWTRLTAGWGFYDYTYTAFGRAADDHGNTTATATNITPTSSTAGVINYAGDNDYFRIVIPTSGRLTLNTTGSTTDTFGYLLDSRGRTIAWNDDGGIGLNFRILRTITAGTYYVRIRHFSSTRTGAYTLISSFSPGAGTGTPSTMISPTPGSTLTSTTATFRWRNTGAAQYYLFVGTTRGAFNIYSGNQGRGLTRRLSENDFATSLHIRRYDFF